LVFSFFWIPSMLVTTCCILGLVQPVKYFLLSSWFEVIVSVSTTLIIIIIIIIIIILSLIRALGDIIDLNNLECPVFSAGLDYM
jgi:hypothetical protein